MTTIIDRVRASRAAGRDRRALLVLWALDALGPTWTFDLAAVTGMPVGGAMHVVLAELERAEFVASDWGDPMWEGGPRRRLYWVTEVGRRHADEIVASLKGVTRGRPS